ncbi:MAG: S41 family peptidase [Planctomycetaceae bacterium]
MPLSLPAAIALSVMAVTNLSAGSQYQPLNPARSTPAAARDEEDAFFPGARLPSRFDNRSDRIGRPFEDDLYPERRAPFIDRRFNVYDDTDSFGFERGGRGGREPVPRFDRFDDWRPDGEYPQRYPSAGDGYGRNPLGDDRTPWGLPALPRVPQERNWQQPEPEPLPTERELINRRYRDPAMLQFVSTLSAERAVAMYAETLRLIATRHLSPPAPQALVERGLANLLTALREPVFLQVARVQAGAQQLAAFEQALVGRLRQMPVRTPDDAVAALQTAMQFASQYLGLSPALVAVEFEYGAMESLDRYSAFVTPEGARMFNQQLGESVVGIGVQIEAADAGVRVLKVLPGGPAEQAGLQKGDTIVAIDGQSLAGRVLEDSSALIAGPEGSFVTLSLERGGAPVQMQLSRRSVAVHSVTEVQFVDRQSGVAYLKLEKFAADSKAEMEQALWALHQQGMQSLILDLRGNPGGLLTTAVEICDLFLPEGTIVSTRGRTSADNTAESAAREQTWKVPLVVLIDGESASASEILAAAIKEHGRGTLVGRRTYGKGSVQTLFSLPSVGAGLRLTTARFYSPSGQEIADRGVAPDVPVAETTAINQGDVRTDRDLFTGVDLARQQLSPRGYDLSQLGQPR